MCDLWSVDGDDLDRGYLNLRTASCPEEQDMRLHLDHLWEMYAPYADTTFRQGFARDPNARFWEMYLGCCLLDAGKRLMLAAERPSRGGQPDICVLEDGRRIWIEAIAPEPGEGEDGVCGPTPINRGGRVGRMPTRQAQLRTTGALLKKTQVFERYLRQGVVAPEDVRIVAIGAGGFGIYATERPLPLIVSSVFPLGDAYVTLDRDTGEVVGSGYEPSYEIERSGSAKGPIPRMAFLDPTFTQISAALWSRIGIGNMSSAERPLTLVHNPMAAVPMRQRWGCWDREFIAVREGDGWAISDILSSEG
ncbi:hypothetical protein [Methylobacterium sp. A54F]